MQGSRFARRIRMGWASYLEDINRKLEEGLAAARERRGSHKPTIDNLSGKKLLRDLEALIGSASRELTRLQLVLQKRILDWLMRKTNLKNLLTETSLTSFMISTTNIML